MATKPTHENSQYWVYSNERTKTYFAFKKRALWFSAIMLGLIGYLILGTARGSICLQKVFIVSKMICMTLNPWFWALFIPWGILGYYFKVFDHSSAPTPPEWVRKRKEK